jgi:hypothetical protein
MREVNANKTKRNDCTMGGVSHLIFVLVPECGEYEICNQKIILRSNSRQRPFFIDRFHSS